jgi:hypothetical protein
MSYFSFRSARNVEDQEIDDGFIAPDEEAFDTLLIVRDAIQDGSIIFQTEAQQQADELIARINRAIRRLEAWL